MPRGDRTGPMGAGPMTGRRAGICAGYPAPGYTNIGMLYGTGFGRGRGFRRMYYLTGTPGWVNVDEKEYLHNQAEFLENQLHQIKKRLDILDDEDK